MKILQLINVRWYNACAHFAISQAITLANRGHEVIVMADPDSPPANAAKKAGLQCETSIKYSKMIETPLNIYRFCKFLKKTNPDIIIAHRGESHLIAAFALRFCKNRISLIRYRGDVRFARTTFFGRWVTNKLTAGIGVSTEKHRQYYLNKFDCPVVKVLYPGIDTDYFAPSPKDKKLANELGIKPHEFVVGLVGRLATIKGHRIFIESAKLLTLKNKNIRFVIAGEDEAIKLDQLKIAAEKWRIADKFIFMGRVDDIRKIISLFDLGVIASTGSESISRVLLEFMAMGIPVVGTEINQIPEILGGCGVLVPPGDPVKMAEAIQTLNDDNKLRETLIQKALTEVRSKYTMAMLGQNSEELIKEVLNGAR